MRAAKIRHRLEADASAAASGYRLTWGAQAKSLQLHEDDPLIFRRQREHRCIHILLCYTQ
jgi:hypothetical protein